MYVIKFLFFFKYIFFRPRKMRLIFFDFLSALSARIQSTETRLQFRERSGALTYARTQRTCVLSVASQSAHACTRRPSGLRESRNTIHIVELQYNRARTLVGILISRRVRDSCRIGISLAASSSFAPPLDELSRNRGLFSVALSGIFTAAFLLLLRLFLF